VSAFSAAILPFACEAAFFMQSIKRFLPMLCDFVTQYIYFAYWQILLIAFALILCIKAKAKVWLLQRSKPCDPVLCLSAKQRAKQPKGLLRCPLAFAKG
jgi:hypothetical protein